MAKILIYAMWVFGVLLITIFMVSITDTVGGILRKRKKNKLNHQELLYSTFDSTQDFKELTSEQIDEIHKKGNLTPAEFVAQCESIGHCFLVLLDIDLLRCGHFQSCHDCIVDWAKNNEDLNLPQDPNNYI